jgi:hypothetical protein
LFLQEQIKDIIINSHFGCELSLFFWKFLFHTMWCELNECFSLMM